MATIDSLSFILALLTAVASGLVGSFALMRRMTLAGDAFSHIALPGIGLAILYSYNPIVGGAAALIVGAFLIWNIERRTRLNTEAIIGVLFSVSLAVGALAIENEDELIETLFGGIGSVSILEFAIGSLVAILVVWFIMAYRRTLVLMLVSEELAKTASVRTGQLQLLFLLAFAGTVILGLQFLGVLLMGSLIIIPAATARNIAKNLTGMLITASGVSVVSVVSGMFAAQFFSVSLGPSIIIVAGAFFVFSLIVGGKA